MMHTVYTDRRIREGDDQEGDKQDAGKLHGDSLRQRYKMSAS